MKHYSSANNTTNQNAFGYALYMMASSLFPRVKISDKLLEEWLNSQYWNQPAELQDYMTDICEKYVDEYLFDNLPEGVMHGSAVVSFEKKKGIISKIIFQAGKTKMSLAPRLLDADSAIIDCSFWGGGVRKHFETLASVSRTVNPENGELIIKGWFDNEFELAA